VAEESSQEPTPESAEAADSQRLVKLLGEVKALAQEYYELTGGRSLQITGEVAEYEAAQLLGLVLAPVRQPGYDAWRGEDRIQIKGCAVLPGKLSSWRMGTLDLDKEWNAAVLVLLDKRYEPTAMYEATRFELEGPLQRLASEAAQKQAKQQGMAVSEFIQLGRQVWPVDA
jgi:hypothetical protein